MAVVAVAGLVALALANPAPSGIVTGVASGAPSASATTAPSPTVPPTPIAHEPWDWTPADVPLASNASQIRNVWAIDSGFIALADDFAVDGGPGSALLTSPDGVTWAQTPLPPQARAIATGMLFEDELWLVGSTGDPDAPVWRLWSTADGTSWDDHGAAKGLVPLGGTVSELAATRAGFVATISEPPTDADHPALEEIRFSSDARTWKRVDLPVDGANLHLAGLIAEDGRWLIAADQDDGTGNYAVSVLSSTDGRQWDSVSVAQPGDGIGLALTAGPSGYVLGGADPESDTYRPVVWRSVDAGRWSRATLDIPPNREGAAIIGALSTERGIVLIGNHGGDAWIATAEADSWSYRNVIKPDSAAFFGAFAVRGDVVVCGGSSDSGIANLWVGSLSAMGL